MLSVLWQANRCWKPVENSSRRFSRSFDVAARSTQYKDQIDSYLKEVAKQYRKLNRKGMPAEITLIGGASILINYGFRDSTYDVDALIQASSTMKDAVNYVTDKRAMTAPPDGGAVSISKSQCPCEAAKRPWQRRKRSPLLRRETGTLRRYTGRSGKRIRTSDLPAPA